MKKISALLLSLLAFTSVAIADDEIKLYTSAGVTSLNYSLSYAGRTYSANIGNINSGTFGTEFNRYISTEVTTSFGTASATGNTISFTGLYAKPTLPVGESLVLFGKVGSMTIKNSDPYVGSFSSASYGLGLDFYPSGKEFVISADYMVLAKSRGEELKGLGVSAGYKF
jgi:hypothetical protein